MKETVLKDLEWKSSMMFTLVTDSTAVESMVHVINWGMYYTWELSVSLNFRQGYKPLPIACDLFLVLDNSTILQMEFSEITPVIWLT